jgi:hypothetical protein
MGTRKNENGLTELQQAVADAYLLLPLEGRSASAAYRAVRPNATARTVEVEGARILSITEVKNYIEEREAEIIRAIQEEQRYNMNNVVADLIELKEICMGKRPVAIIEEENKEGEKVAVEIKKVNPQGAARALELLGKSFGGFTDKISVDTTHEDDIELLA